MKCAHKDIVTDPLAMQRVMCHGHAVCVCAWIRAVSCRGRGVGPSRRVLAFCWSYWQPLRRASETNPRAMAACDSALDMDLHNVVVVGVHDVTWSCMYMYNDIHVIEICRRKEEVKQTRQPTQGSHFSKEK